MLMKQVDRSQDLKRLRDEGYEIEIKGGYLLTHHIPYVNKKSEIKYGKLIVKLCLNGDITIKPNTHVIYFMGEFPCYKDGSEITSIKNSNPNILLFDGIVMNWMFSNKPKNGYNDYYELVTRYANIISAPAMSLNKNVSVKTFKIIDNEEDSVFKYADSNTTRANIYYINNKLNNQKIAIIGLGGTGSYILDLIAKTPVAEIHLYDDDNFCQHNAFRAPGAPAKTIFDDMKKKVDYFSEIYSNMHKGIKSHSERITTENVEQLFQMSFVFVCIDDDNVRGKIIQQLNQNNVSLIDVGMGVRTVDDFIIGTLRITVITPKKYDHISRRIPMSNNSVDNEYTTNIQIADLNALNANLAVIEWKKLSGFYQDMRHFHNLTYTINDSNLVADEEL
ncbi:MAG: ThiF family adenylyltransferase [Dysgonamonadaceae bacterium]|nr:ThiF family adenylyltransferase [Dysgonamonadaceae bacterium]